MLCIGGRAKREEQGSNRVRQASQGCGGCQGPWACLVSGGVGQCCAWEAGAGVTGRKRYARSKRTQAAARKSQGQPMASTACKPPGVTAAESAHYARTTINHCASLPAQPTQPAYRTSGRPMAAWRLCRSRTAGPSLHLHVLAHPSPHPP